VLTDLGTLEGLNSEHTSIAHRINDRGWIAGFSYTGGLDLVTGSAGGHAVLWRDGEIVDLGTLGEDFSGATTLNKRIEV